jgi:hypothetical protein
VLCALLVVRNVHARTLLLCTRRINNHARPCTQKQIELAQQQFQKLQIAKQNAAKSEIQTLTAQLSDKKAAYNSAGTSKKKKKADMR